MNLRFEFANCLRPNELQRLKCAVQCGMSHQCIGMEAQALLKLGLADMTSTGFALSELGHDVLRAVSSATSLIPNLKGGSQD
ncbi:hypothetical protein [Albirhodobacter sp. R86504]|jgi:hypothetical protein|uniref:hypothetical protein n=1 Tax=Albirhodobacter sp. R86504 TaxID=3093848 RepID=UPI00367082B6